MGRSAFPANGYWWVSIAGPLVGGVTGGGLYCLLIPPYLSRGSGTPATDPEVLP